MIMMLTAMTTIRGGRKYTLKSQKIRLKVQRGIKTKQQKASTQSVTLGFPSVIHGQCACYTGLYELKENKDSMATMVLMPPAN